MTEQEVIEIIEAKIAALEVSLVEKLKQVVAEAVAEITG
jgi:hypothetical protein